MSEFADLEAQDGVRMTWNVLPGTKQEANNCAVPVAAVYTPIKPLPSSTPTLSSSPLRCKTCGSVLNPFSVVDFVANVWICCFCSQRNAFPPSYYGFTEENLPAELFHRFTTIEYESDLPASPPVILLVVDTCLWEDEICFLKSSLSQAIAFLPDSTLVGLITFGRVVQVHELGYSNIPKTYVFHGGKDVSKDILLERMGFFLQKPRPSTGVVAGSLDGISSESISRFLLPVSQCSFVLNSVLVDLEKDSWPVLPDQRAARCTGTAISIAASLLGACYPGSSARIMAFIGGAATEGSGSIVSVKLSEPLRSHKDLENASAPYYHKAVNFYENLAQQLVHQGHVLDIFACSVDQVGIAELKVTVERTGGFIVLAESFGDSVFKESLNCIVKRGAHDLGISSNAIFEVHCSKEVKIQGAIGPCASLGKKCFQCSETNVGQGNTSAWKMCGLMKATSLCLFFEIVKMDASDSPVQSYSSQFYFQFLTYYQDSNGQTRLRVTTISRSWVAGPKCSQDLLAGFDQQAAVVVIARLMSFKMETEVKFDPIRWLDNMLINTCSRFGEYEKENAASFTLSARLSAFPLLIFHLRRSQFVQVFNNSPDETAYFRVSLNRENVSNSVLMIQPSLISYSLHSGVEPTLLDVAAIAADRILLFDSYSMIVIFHGATISQWRKAGSHQQAKHLEFAELLRLPHTHASYLMQDRFPCPRLVTCDQYSSQARFLLAKLDPSSAAAPGGDIILTDDVSYDIFVSHLRKLVVQ